MWMGAGLLVKLFHQPEIGSFFKAAALAIKERNNAIGISDASENLPVRKVESEHVLQAEVGYVPW